MTKTPKWAIQVKDLSFSYGDEQVLVNISINIAPKTLCAIVGPNGGGKSTLIQCITGLLPPDSGTAKVYCEHSRTNHSIGYVPQRHFLGEHFPVSVFEVVSTGRVLGQKKWFRLNERDKKVIEHSIDSVGLADHMNCQLNELSGGQQQRVLIAKALAGEPDVLVLDEPTAGVDSASQKLFHDTIAHTIEKHDTTVLLVSHELSAIKDLVDQVVVLKNRVIFDGAPSELTDQGVSLGIHEHDLPVWLESISEKPISKASQ